MRSKFAVMTDTDLAAYLELGGATIPIHAGQSVPSFGFMVGGLVHSLVLPVGSATVADVHDFLSANEDVASSPNVYLGLWNDGKGNLHIDLSEWVSDEFDAITLCVIRAELAIWDIANADEIHNPTFERK